MENDVYLHELQDVRIQYHKFYFSNFTPPQDGLFMEVLL